MKKRSRKVNRKAASMPTIRRLPAYLQIVRQAEEDGILVISGTSIAEALELEPIQVRKDLAVTGISGKPRVGYVVRDLVKSLENFLRWDTSHNAIIMGAGNLGSALIGHADFRRNGLNILGAFDSDPQKVGTECQGIPVMGLSQLAAFVKENQIKLAIITVPANVAQETCQDLLALGVSSLWNFTSAKIRLPQEYLGKAMVQKEDLSSGYAVLSVLG